MEIGNQLFSNSQNKWSDVTAANGQLRESTQGSGDQGVTVTSNSRAEKVTEMSSDPAAYSRLKHPPPSQVKLQVLNGFKGI